MKINKVYVLKVLHNEWGCAEAEVKLFSTEEKALIAMNKAVENFKKDKNEEDLEIIKDINYIYLQDGNAEDAEFKVEEMEIE